MWQDSGFARPVSSFEAPVRPPGADPTIGPFAYVAVNKVWMPYVLGALQQLLLQTTWDTDNPDVLNLAQEQAFNLIQQFQLATEDCPAGSVPVVIAESDYEMSICEQLRIHNGKLQGLCCGEWTDIPGQTAGEGIGASPQPGDGQPQPTPGGGCQTYHAVMQANTAWNAPVGVNAGDIITVSGANGATYDGGYSSWRCWDGNTFFLGACIPGTGGLRSTDPLPTIKHMHLIASIDGTFYDVSTPITVPGGVSNAQLIFQVNDDVLGDNGGSLAFDVEVCNNTPADWTSVMPFDVSTFGFVPFARGVSGSTGDWTPTVGFVDGDGEDAGPEWVRSAGAQLTGITPFTLKSMEVVFDLTLGGFASPSELAVHAEAVSGGAGTDYIAIANSAASSGSGQDEVGAAVTPAVDTLIVLIQCSTSTASIGSLTGAATLTKLIVTGSGPKPPELP